MQVAHAARAEMQAHHPCIYAACKFICRHVAEYGLEMAVDALGATFGDPFLYEEIKLIYYGLKWTYHISKRLYHWLRSTTHKHGQRIVYLAHHH